MSQQQRNDTAASQGETSTSAKPSPLRVSSGNKLVGLGLMSLPLSSLTEAGPERRARPVNSQWVVALKESFGKTLPVSIQSALTATVPAGEADVIRQQLLDGTLKAELVDGYHRFRVFREFVQMSEKPEWTDATCVPVLIYNGLTDDEYEFLAKSANDEGSVHRSTTIYELVFAFRRLHYRVRGLPYNSVDLVIGKNHSKLVNLKIKDIFSFTTNALTSTYKPLNTLATVSLDTWDAVEEYIRLAETGEITGIPTLSRPTKGGLLSIREHAALGPKLITLHRDDKAIKECLNGIILSKTFDEEKVKVKVAKPKKDAVPAPEIPAQVKSVPVINEPEPETDSDDSESGQQQDKRKAPADASSNPSKRPKTISPPRRFTRSQLIDAEVQVSLSEPKSDGQSQTHHVLVVDSVDELRTEDMKALKAQLEEEHKDNELLHKDLELQEYQRTKLKERLAVFELRDKFAMLEKQAILEHVNSRDVFLDSQTKDLYRAGGRQNSKVLHMYTLVHYGVLGEKDEYEPIMITGLDGKELESSNVMDVRRMILLPQSIVLSKGKKFRIEMDKIPK